MSGEVTRILLIEDDHEDYLILKDILNEIYSYHFEIHWKYNFDEGFKSFLTGIHDVCLLDYRLGSNDGLELLKKMVKANIPCPIIMLTGLDDIFLDKKAMQAGASDYLVKDGLDSRHLERVLRYSIKHARDIKALEDRERNFKTLFDSTFEGIAVHDKGYIIEANNSLVSLLGYSKEEMRGQDIINYIHSNYKESFKNALNNQEFNSLELIAIKNDLTEVSVELSNREIHLDNEKLFILAFWDLTERKNMEEQLIQQDRLASLGLLASSLAHEIGNPLAVIQGRNQMLENHFINDEFVLKDLKIISNQINRITKLVRSLLDIARKKELENTERVSLNNVLSNLQDLIHYELEKNRINFNIDINNNVFVKAESGQLSQVFLNLILNAKYAIEEEQKKNPDKDYEIRIAVKKDEKNVIINLSDNGIGIPKENLSNLFKPFFTTKEIGEGTGLGLATSYKILQSWNGSISAHQAKAGGAKFVISLPLAKAH